MAWYSSMAAESSARAWLSLADLGVQGAEAAVAVGLERAHAQFLGQGEGLAVVGFGLSLSGGSRRAAISPRRRRAYAWWPRSWCCTGKRQRTLGEGVRLLQAAGQQLRLPQGETTERLMADRFRCSGLFQRLREQRHGVGDAPGQGVRRAQGRSHQGKQTGRSPS